MEYALYLVFRLLLNVPIVRIFALAVFPALFLLYWVRRQDRLEPEPPKLIWSLVGLGALSALLAMALETAGMLVLLQFVPRDSLLLDILQYFLIVGLGEEFCKLLMLRLRTWKHPDFNCLYDGMVYAVAVSAGFALLENLLYVFRYGPSVVFIRAVVSIPGHICMAVFMGTWYSAAREYQHRGETERQKRAQVLSLLVPALVHGGFDMIAVRSDSTPGIIVFALYVITMFVVSWRLVRKLAGKDRYFPEKTDSFA